MIKLWLSQKLHFLSHVACFIAGLVCIVVPWYIAFLILAGALALDYIAFRFEYSE